MMRELKSGGALVATVVAHLENEAGRRSVRVKDSQTPESSSSSRPKKATAMPTPTPAPPKESSSDNDKAKSTSEKDSSDSSSSSSSSSKSSSPDRDPDDGEKRGSDSDSPDDSTVKCGNNGSNYSANYHHSSSSASSSSSEDESVNQRSKSKESSSCRDNTFQWIKSPENPQKQMQVQSIDDDQRKLIKTKRNIMSPKLLDKPPVPSHSQHHHGSLDRRRHHSSSTSRSDRDQKSRSSHNLKSPSPRHHYDVDYASTRNNNIESCNTTEQSSYHSYTPPRHMSDMQRRALSYEHFNKRHEHNDPQRYGSNSMLSEYQYPYYYNSRQDLHTSQSELVPIQPPWHMGGCYYHGAPPCCGGCSSDRFRNMPYSYKTSDVTDDRVRRLESEKENLQLQVTVLSEQIAAQSDKITDLERLLGEKKTLLSNAEELLQREMLTRSSLETQKLELMSTISDSRLRQAALERENIELRGSRPSPGPNPSLPNGNAAGRKQSPSPCPSPAPSLLHNASRESSTPRTPPATYRRLVHDQTPHQYSSLPRGSSLTSTPIQRTPQSPAANTPMDTAVVVRFGKPNQQHCMVVARGRGHSVPNLAEKDTVIGTASPILGKLQGSGGKGWGSLFRGGSGSCLEDIQDDIKDPFQRGGVRATAAPRLQTTNYITERWSSTPLKDWDADITCEWLESMGLDCYNVDAKKWLTSPAGNKGIIASATPQQIEKELNLKNPLHKKKITLALIDLQNSSTDPLLKVAGRLDAAWALRWLEDTGLPQYREAWAAATIDGRVLHRLCHEDLHALKVTSQLHALSIRRGIQVLRENNFSPDTMIRRAATAETAGESEADSGGGHVSRWSSHRVMEWLRAVDLAEYAPNLRGAGVHGGLMYYETRFTGELLAALLNIPPSKTLLRRHLNTRFNQLLGKEVIQEKREAEQTLGYQPLTLTSKVKVTKKGQFTLKRKKNKGEPEYGDLVCPIVDQLSGETITMTKMDMSGVEVGGVYRQTDEISNSTDSPHSQRSDNSRS